MKKLLFMVLICFAGSSVTTFGFTRTTKHSGTSDRVAISKGDLLQNKDTPVKEVYTCPMHPEVIQDKPGKCPKCKMNLEKKEIASVVYTCPMHPEVIQDKPGKCPKCKMNLEKKEIASMVYTCSMHPEVIQDKPGKCPKCKMNLVKKETAKK